VRNGKIGLGCLCCFHARSHPLGEAACGFGTDLHTQESAEHLSRLLERHATGQVNQMFLLTRGERSGQ
jgi:hypothetical protein